MRLFFPDAQTIPLVAPDSVRWFHSANLILRSGACLIGANLPSLRPEDWMPARPDIFLPRQTIAPPPYRISLDRTFQSRFLRYWHLAESRTPSLSCPLPRLRLEFLAALGAIAHQDDPCPFCQAADAGEPLRIQASYPARPTINMPERNRAYRVLFVKLAEPRGRPRYPSDAMFWRGRRSG